MQSESGTPSSHTYNELADKRRCTLHGFVLFTAGLLSSIVNSVVCLGQMTDSDGTGDETTADLVDQLYSANESARQAAIHRLSSALNGNDVVMDAVVRLARSSRETETARGAAIQAIIDAEVVDVNVCREFIDMVKNEKTPVAIRLCALVIVCYGSREHRDAECSRVLREAALRRNGSVLLRRAAITYLPNAQMTGTERIDVLRRCVEQNYDFPDVAVAAIKQLEIAAFLSNKAAQARSLLLQIAISRKWGVSVRLSAIDSLDNVAMFSIEDGEISLNKEEQAALRGLITSVDEHPAIKRAVKDVLSNSQ